MKVTPPPLEIVATGGTRLITADGRSLIDGMASWWAACHGYNHPSIVSAVQEQASRMPHVMFGGITHEPAEQLAENLLRRVDPSLRHIFFADSGSVAVEVAMKMAIGYWRRHGQPHRHRFVAFDNAYHGDTTGAMSLCDPDRGMHAAYGRGILPQLHAELPVDPDRDAAFDEMLARNREVLAGVFVEPLVQGAGGMRFHDSATLQRIADACRRHDLLLIFDEIATGFGRLGSMFAHQIAGITPDMTCLGKALTAGTMTMAVTLTTDRVFDAFWSDDVDDALMHGPTFMANPLACAAANASLHVFDRQPTQTRVAEIESRLREGLSPCRHQPGVIDVRCRGAVGVIEMESLGDLHALRQAIIDQGVWLRPFGDCLYTTPSLNIGNEDLDCIVDAMVAACGRVSQQRLTQA